MKPKHTILIFSTLSVLCLLFYCFGRLGEICIVPSGSMERTIAAGDIIWVNKSSAHLDVNSPSFLRNDVMVFEHSNNLAEHLVVKRIIGLPKDEIVMDNSIPIVNGRPLRPKDTDIFEYLTDLDIRLVKKHFERHRIVAVKIFEQWGDTHLFLTVSDARKAVATGLLVHLPYSEPQSRPAIKIPGKNMTILLNDSTYGSYSKIIKKYEHRDLRRVGKDQYREDGKKVTQLAFKHNYYFVLGDNRPNSYDSRHFGLICDTAIYGKATRVLFNSKTFKRFFRTIN